MIGNPFGPGTKRYPFGGLRRNDRNERPRRIKNGRTIERIIAMMVC